VPQRGQTGAPSGTSKPRRHRVQMGTNHLLSHSWLRPNGTAKLPGPPARTLNSENKDGGPGQLQPLVRRLLCFLALMSEVICSVPFAAAGPTSAPRSTRRPWRPCASTLPSRGPTWGCWPAARPRRSPWSPACTNRSLPSTESPGIAVNSSCRILPCFRRLPLQFPLLPTEAVLLGLGGLFGCDAR